MYPRNGNPLDGVLLCIPKDVAKQWVIWHVDMLM